MAKLREAAELTGLSVWELRTGALSGKYPAMRIGGKRGTFIFDVDLIKDRIAELMKANIQEQNNENVRIPIKINS